MQRREACVFLMTVMICSVASGQAVPATHWEVQQVDALGNCTYPLVGAPMVDGLGNPIETNKVELTGVVIAAPGDLADVASTYLVVVQGEGDDHAGTQLYSGIFFHDPASWPEYPLDILAGDRVRCTGFVMDFIGKTNINERHSGSPAVNFEIEVLEHVGMPEPEVVPTLADANFFDQTRLAGGEFYQSRYVRLNSVEIVGGEIWDNNNQVVISDGTGQLGLMLSATGDFDQFGPPAGKFDVIGVFDQEPHPLDWAPSNKTGNYRLWIKNSSAIIVPTEAPQLIAAASRKLHGSELYDIDLPLDETAPGTEPRRDGLETMVLTFSEGVVAVDGDLGSNEFAVSHGQVDAVIQVGLDVIVELSGVPDGACFEMSVTGVTDLAGNALTGDADIHTYVLAGDASGDRLTNVNDFTLIRSKNGIPVTSESVRYDVSCDGLINVNDFTLVRSLNQNKIECQ